MPLYADIVLPLAQPAYTFAVPEGMHVEAGQAVAVQFGARKFYTGIVWRVHDRRPPFKTVKPIQRVLYGAPLLSAQQMAFWEWVAAYYMCTPGEVMRVGLPSLMKPSGDTEEEFTEEEFAAVFGDRYVNADEAERRQALVDFALPKNIAGMQETLAKYRIQYDNWFYESTVHQDGELAETIELFRQAGLTYEKDGALWYKATERGAEKDEVLVRANGNPTYFAADVAYHRNKLVKRGYDQAIDIWGADHHGHVARMKGALEAIGIDPNRLDVILMQLVRLVSGGEVVRMSKRTGKAITLTDLLDDIPVDAARFLFNLREPGSQMEFDLDLAVEQSAQNPVYYCQYAHARICSILKKLASEGVAPRECTGQELCLLATPEERALIRHLAALTDEIVLSAKNYDPARITRYVIELATLFHKFYNACRVRVEDEALMQARIYLCICVRDTIRNILEMLKIMVPESM